MWTGHDRIGRIERRVADLHITVIALRVRFFATICVHKDLGDVVNSNDTILNPITKAEESTRGLGRYATTAVIKKVSTTAEEALDVC